MSTEQSIFQALCILGASADEVAERLDRMGFRGTPSDATHCPVARYLQETLHRRSVGIGNDVCVVGGVGGVSFPLPPPVVAFIRGFDVGQYPALVDDQLTHVAGCPAEPDHCTCPR